MNNNRSHEMVIIQFLGVKTPLQIASVFKRLMDKKFKYAVTYDS